MITALRKAACFAVLSTSGALQAQAVDEGAARLTLMMGVVSIEPYRVFPESRLRAWGRWLRHLGHDVPVLNAGQRTAFRVYVTLPNGKRVDVTMDPHLHMSSDGCLRLDYEGSMQPDARASCGDPTRPRFYLSYPTPDGRSRIASFYRFRVSGISQRLPGLPEAQRTITSEGDPSCPVAYSPCSPAASSPVR